VTATTSRPARRAPAKAAPRKPSRKPTRKRRGPLPANFLLLVALFAVLNLIGLVMILSASSIEALRDHGSSWLYFNRQLVWVALGAGVIVVTARVDYRVWRRLALPLLILSAVLLLLVLIPGVGVRVYGSTRWLGVGQLRVQPSELAKLAVLIFSADLLARRATKITDTRITLRPVLVVLAVVAGLIMKQPDLGTTLVVGAIVLTVLFVSGVPLRPIAAVGGAAAALVAVLALSADYRRARLSSFMNPWDDPLNQGYQTLQSMVGLASGGLFGVGLGASRAKWGFLPNAHTDFIFAIIGEELGLVGAATVVLLFVALGVLGVRTALQAPDRFGMLLAAGVTAWFLVQAFVNIGAVVAVLPITGVPLPFVSAGGSSLLVSMAAGGILLNVARQGR
jgi:cell division protein FtsW